MRFVLISFAFLGWAFYEVSGGGDFQPAPREAALPAENPAPATAPAKPVPVTVTVVAPVADPAPAPTPTASVVTQPQPQPMLPSVSLVSLEQSGTLFAQPVARLKDTPIDETQAATATDIRSITGSRVNVRNGPGTNYSVVMKLTRGAEVVVLDDLGNGWVKLRSVDGGQVGWMADFLLSDPTG